MAMKKVMVLNNCHLCKWWKKQTDSKYGYKCKFVTLSEYSFIRSIDGKRKLRWLTLLSPLSLSFFPPKRAWTLKFLWLDPTFCRPRRDTNLISTTLALELSLPIELKSTTNNSSINSNLIIKACMNSQEQIVILVPKCVK